MVQLLHFLIDLYILAVIVRAVISWLNVNPYNPVVRFLTDITEPVLSRIRSIIPAMGGLDLSPLILILVLSLLRNLIY